MANRREVGYNGSLPQQSHCPAERPLQSFFKIILSTTLEDKKLRIPDKFVKKFGDELSDVANLIVPSGSAWQVRLTKAQRQIWFDDGWQEFVEHHSICYGHFLVFRYRGFSNFTVIIFDMTACEIQYPHDGQISGPGPISGEGSKYCEKCSKSHEDEKDDDDSIGILGSTVPSPYHCSLKRRVSVENASRGESSKRHTPPGQDLAVNKHLRRSASPWSSNFDIYDTRGKQCLMEEHVEITNCDANELRSRKLDKHGMASPHGPLVNEIKGISTFKSEFGRDELLPRCEEDKEIMTGGFQMAPQESERAIHAARTFKPKYPSFTVVLRAYNIEKCIMYVPSGFARRYLSEVPNYIKLQVSNGREWPVKVIRRKHTSFTLGSGLVEFCRENNLKEGDVCVFQLIKYSAVLEVSIFHTSQGVRPLN